MAKVKVKEWVIFLVVATWLLTTLSACFTPTPPPPQSKAPTKEQEKTIWGRWYCNQSFGRHGGALHSGHGYWIILSRQIDDSGIERIRRQHFFGVLAGNSDLILIADGKWHRHPTASDLFYRNSWNGQKGILTSLRRRAGEVTRNETFVGRNGLLWRVSYKVTGDEEKGERTSQRFCAREPLSQRPS